MSPTEKLIAEAASRIIDADRDALGRTIRASALKEVLHRDPTMPVAAAIEAARLIADFIVDGSTLQ